MLMFAHGFSVHFGTVRPPADVDVTMIAPKGPGHLVRRTYEEGIGTPALVAVQQDATGNGAAARPRLRRGDRRRPGRASSRPPSRRRPRPTCSASSRCCAAGSRRWSRPGSTRWCEAGYQPEIAYFECLHELKLIVDLIYEGGLSWMRYSISDTAEWGDYLQRTRGSSTRAFASACARSWPRSRTAPSRRSGWGRPRPASPTSSRCVARPAARSSRRVGRELRPMMPWLHSEEKVVPDAERNDPDVVRIFDTTLRDGEQAPGIALTRAEKVEIAEQLARLEVDVIEAGFPVSSEGEFEAVSEIASSVKGPVIAALARVVPGDIDPRGRGARRRRALADPHVHLDQRHPHDGHAPDEQRAGPGRDPRGRQARRRATPTTSSSAPRTPPAPSSTSCSSASASRWTPARRRSTCPTPSGTRCRTSSASSSARCARRSPTTS